MDEKRYLKLNDIDAYKITFQLSNYVWDIVLLWEHFARDTIGKQFVRALDSNSANIAEGFGRHSKKEKVVFFRYARGSVLESLDWNEKAKLRNLITTEQYTNIYAELQKMPRLINQLIKYTNDKLQQ